MKKHRLKKSVGIFAMLAVAVGLLIFSSVGGARAALTYYSETYTSQFEMFDIGITLNENGNPVHRRNFDKEKREFVTAFNQTLLNHITKFDFGQKYEEVLTVSNSGTIDEYVRLTIRRYWEDTTSGKRLDLDPSLINIHLVEGTPWILDKQYSDAMPERIVLYYSKPIASGVTTVGATDWITVDKAVQANVKTVKSETDPVTNKTVITTTYTYDGLNFVLEAEAEGVQTHNAKDAIKSAWGRDVNIAEDGTLSLVN